MKIGLVIPIFNREEYLLATLNSLRKAKVLPGLHIVFVDDCSDRLSSRAYAMLNTFKIRRATTYIIRNDKNVGVRNSLKIGLDYCIENGYELLMNIDSDIVIRNDYFIGMTELKLKFPRSIISGFNCTMPDRDKVISIHEGYSMKESVGGCSLLFNAIEYKKYIRPALDVPGNWDHTASIASLKDGNPIIVSTPSICQHIGMQSGLGHSNNPSVADDFKPLSLPDVTLFGIDTLNWNRLHRAADICNKNVYFGDHVIMTGKIFEGRTAYSQWIIKELGKIQFKTSHILLIQHDGYIQNWEAWRDEWLEWDYIGAPWDWYNEKQVGNGGFSLRSVKLLKALSEDPNIPALHPEDDTICRLYRDYLIENHGIRFAPLEVAKKFAIEAWGLKQEYQVYGGEFGFHSCHVRNLPYPL